MRSNKILDKRSSGGVFDRDILNYLLNQINTKDHHSDDHISKIEFGNSYIELNIFFTDRVHECQNKSEEIKKAIREYENDLRDQKDKYTPN